MLAMAASIGTLMVDVFATSHFRRTQKGNASDEERTRENENHLPIHTHATHGHGHAHGPVSTLHHSDSAQLLRQRIVSQVLELGILVHSVIIGISLGASESPKTIKPLVAALPFHQFFEGMGLADAKFNCRAVTLMVLFFSLTTPVGIAIGIGITNIYDESSPTALIVEGLLNAASAGILIYMALVDLLAADFMNPKLQNNGLLQVGASVSLLLGATMMSLLAIWA
ncbi:hypothetical protein V6N12_023014 [Hibiscus sabdariffa]|uniref:Uncharacterized protein n=1 Tax=Hibiscus sabdariffa TaxID=183260 RepID=A0ABR2FWF0_9ROSI